MGDGHTIHPVGPKRLRYSHSCDLSVVLEKSVTTGVSIENHVNLLCMLIWLSKRISQFQV